jgi:hypothetical protein
MAVRDIVTITTVDGMVAVPMAAIAALPTVATATAITARTAADPTGAATTEADAIMTAITASNSWGGSPAGHFFVDRLRSAMCFR